MAGGKANGHEPAAEVVYLNADNISEFLDRGKSRRRTERVLMPEWKVDPDDENEPTPVIFATAMAGADRRAFLRRGLKDDPQDGSKKVQDDNWFRNDRDATLIYETICDGNAKRLFTLAQAHELVDGEDPALYIRLLGACERANVLDDELFTSIRKNSSTPMSVSSNGLQSNSAIPASS